MKYEAVIFDLDGTILNTIDDLAFATNYALKANGLPERTVDEVRHFVGNGIRKLIERAVPSGSPEEMIQKVNGDFTSYYSRHCTDRTRPYDGIPELLGSLRSEGCRTAVVSNKDDYAVQTLCRVYFPSLFDVVVGVRAGISKKPSPDTVNEVMRQLGMDKSRCVYIGDSEVDIQTAGNAGIPCISVAWGFKGRRFLEENNASAIADTAGGLLSLLK